MRSGAAAAMLCALCAVSRLAAADQAAAEGSAESGALGSYEQVALDQALERRGLTVEPSPEGKRVRQIVVVNLPVFGPDAGFLTWFNLFHITTRERVIAREVLVEPGDLWDQEAVDETRRRLRDPLFTTLVVIVPVVATDGAPGEVDLLVVTRDIWSLRLNSRYELQQNVISDLTLAASENNLLGMRKQIALVFNMDLGAFTLGPQYIDKNIAGTRLELLTRADAVFNRATQQMEGAQGYLKFSYPLWSLSRKWGAGIEASYFDAVRRSFTGTELRTYDNPDTDEEEALPYRYRELSASVESSVVRQFGSRALKHQITFGHQLSLRRPEVTDEFPDDDVALAAFARDVMPRSERASAVFGRYSLFTPTYQSYRNLDSFDLPEDRQLGPEFTVELGAAREEIGSEDNFLYASTSASYTIDIIDDGLAVASASASGRLQDGEGIDNQLGASVGAISPALVGMRLAARVAWARRYNETNNYFFTLGGESGLRGYSIAAFAGQLRVLGNLELRSLPVRILFSRVGGLLFWDIGHAADCYSGCDNSFALHQDVGLGLRALIPQLQPFVFRLDWAVPLTATPSARAGLPGRIIAGVKQVF